METLAALVIVILVFVVVVSLFADKDGAANADAYDDMIARENAALDDEDDE